MQIFFPYAFERFSAVETQGTRFVHYTNADAAMGILRTQEVWMRKSSCMNDFMEVEHGLHCVLTAYNQSEHGKNFREALDRVFEGISKEIERYFNGWMSHFRTETYFVCFSEHESTEDTFGRLSMWRAYGKNTGVAFVFKNAPFLTPSDALKAYTSPVAYLDDHRFGGEFKKITDKIQAEGDFIRSMGREAVIGVVFEMLRYAALCTKHPGFSEEKEWRIVYCPTYQKSEFLKKEIQVIGGTPQPIYKIPLKNISDEGLVGVEIPELLDRIIIGPTEYPSAMREAFTQLLMDAGVKEAGCKVFVSDIPVRR
jgi:hypothetical protein